MKGFASAAAAFTLSMAPTIGLSSTGTSKPPERLACSFHWENDMLALASDEDYSQGMRVSCLTDRPIEPAEKFLKWWCGMGLCRTDSGSDPWTVEPSGGFALGQIMYTPANLVTTEDQPFDRPYGAFLHYDILAGIQRVKSDQRAHEQAFELQLGVIGPAAGGEFAQKEWHKVIRDDIPAGWRNQIPNEPAINFHSLGRHRYPLGKRCEHREPVFDLIPHYRGSVGNVLTQASAGVTVRVGVHMPRFPTKRIPEVAPLSPTGYEPRLKTLGERTPGESAAAEQEDSEPPRHGFSFSLGAEASYVLHDVFLDGNLFRSVSLDIDKEGLTYDWVGGLSYRYRRWMLDYVFVEQSSQFESPDGTPDGKHRFGAVVLTFLMAASNRS